MSADHGESSLAAPLILLVSAILGFIISNSSGADAYFSALHAPILFSVAHFDIIDKSLLHIVNDGLMAVFFLLIGLELKREIIIGELSDLRQAALPIFAAIGGMVVPALLYFVLNPQGEAAQGWGIPMATDIAFAMGVLAFLGSRVPSSLKILLAAIAIVDDLGAIIVIALFYTSQIKMAYLGYAGICFGTCIVMNRLGVMKLSLYLLVGLPLWYFMLKSGVHATIAGVLLAATIPLAPKSHNAEKLINSILSSEASPLDSPAVFLEKSLLPWIGFLIIPIFAFCNSGVPLGAIEFTNVSFGVILGLVVGKPLGVVGAAFLANTLKIASLPKGVSLKEILGVGCLAGIGFTMSLFVTSLAFSHDALVDQAKLAIILASTTSGFLGVLILARPKS
ncbi:MAG: Na+/H+ antiporter NhaA [Oligoflexales bacterium]